jgi:uncharacterized RmlC-like cupin family protein
MPPRSGGSGGALPPELPESFLVLDGHVRSLRRERLGDGRAGDYLYVPDGGVHAFGNESDAPASMLILFAPGTPRERYFMSAGRDRRVGPRAHLGD